MSITTKINVLLAVVFGLFVWMGMTLGGSLTTDSRPSDYKEQMLQRLKEQNKHVINEQKSKVLSGEIHATVQLQGDGGMWRNQEKNPLPKVYGNTMNERFGNFIKYFGYNPSHFREAGRRTHIKEEVIACIVWADTSFVSLKSANNPGNVGNNDRGEVKHFATIQQGINAIGYTLSNRYLGRYTKIGELSNGGRKILGLPSCGKGHSCYATSEEYRNKNVLDCLSFMHGKKINEDFNHKYN